MFFSKRFLLLAVLWMALTEVVCAATVRVFAAASLADALKEIAAAYEKESGEKVAFNFAASSMLALQIEQGAPADVFFSADEVKMDALERKGLIVKGTRRSRLGNSLVIVVAKEDGAAMTAPKDLAGQKVKRLALGETRTVPAGIYAKEYLQKQNLWAAVEAKVVPTENVRAALSAVEAGNAEAGIVYKTDAGISRKVRVAYEVPVAEGPLISYPMAVMSEAKNAEGGRKFLTYLEGEEAGKVFERFGFLVHKSSP